VTDQTGQGDRPSKPEDELSDLEEVRAARALAQALEPGPADPPPDVLEALRGAATVASTGSLREPSAERLDALADELFAPPARRRGRRLFALGAIASGALAAAGLVFVLRGPVSQVAPSPSEAQALKSEASALVSALLPPGGSASGRARVIAEEARTRAVSGRSAP